MASALITIRGFFMSDTVTMTLDEAQSMSQEILTRHGYAQPHAEAITRSVVAAQRDECHSHGLYRLIGCVDTLLNGGVDPQAVPEIIDHAPGVVVVDAHRGCSLLAFEQDR